MPSGEGKFVATLLAGIDVGVRACTVGVYTPAGAPVAEWRRPTPRDAGTLVAAVLGGLAECVGRAGAPAAVGIAGAAEGGVPLGADLVPLINDWRGPGERHGDSELFHVTGVAPDDDTALARWLWLRRHEPGLLDRMRVWAGIPELVATTLCGTPISHRTLAGRSGAFDQREDRYDPELLALAGVSESRLPALRTGSATAGPLAVGTPVAVVGHDHLVAAHAVGAREPGDVVDSLGTAEAVVTVSERVAPDAAAGTGTSWNRTADGERWALVSTYPDGDRLRNWLSSLGHEPAAVPAPTGVVVLPYFSGRGAPAPDPDARLAVHDLAPGQALPDVLAAALEGACYHARWLAEHHADLAGTKLAATTVVGGDEAWLSVKAQVMPGPVRVARTADAACAGAALLAGAAVGLPAPVLRSDALTRDDLLADRYDAIYRERFLSRVREVA